MISMPYERIVEKIKEKTNISDSELQSRINKKLDQLSGLISREGAAHIIANELGVKLFEPPKGGLKIKDILTGMRDLEIAGKTQRVFNVAEFESEKRSGKVGSFIMGDETGSIRVVLWNDQADKLAKIKEGSIVKIKGAYVRDNDGRKEAHLGERGSLIINPEGVQIGEVKQITATRRKLGELKQAEDGIEIMGTIVQVFNPTFFEICPECRKRLKPKENSFFCDQHGEQEPVYSYVLNTFLDDGTETTRAVFFRNQAERLLKKTPEEILQYKDHPESFEQVKTDLLGEQVRLVGRAVRNELFDRIEFITNFVFEADPKEEIERLKSE